MDCQTGRIYQDEDFYKKFKKLQAENPERFKEMFIAPTPKQMSRKPPKINKNEDCPCGSGQKFKNCCLQDKQDKRFK